MLDHWQGIVHFPLGKRSPKPRKNGLTMVIDKGLGLRELSDLLEVAGDCLDFLKLGFGTSVLYPDSILKAKIKLCREYQVQIYPGGTLMEIAFLQNRFNLYLEEAQKLGFETLEISDGTIPLDSTRRKYCLKRAVKAGFTVLTELGKKDPRQVLSPKFLCEQCAEDLSNGAWKVIMEARDSGKGIGLFNQQGELQEKRLDDLLEDLPQPENIIWEAPLKNQQVKLIERFGAEVNLGNIQPPELFSLEALRCGLRNDTLRFTEQMSVSTCCS